MIPTLHLLAMLTVPLAPLLLAVAVLLQPRSRILHSASVLAPLPALAVGLLMPPGLGATLPWLLEGSEFGLDPVGRAFLIASAAVWLAAAAFAVGGPPAEGRGRFFVFLLLAMAGNLGLIVARDMLAFYLLFSLMSFSAYGLVVHDGSARARRAGAVYIALVVAGDMMLYAALVPAAFSAGGEVLLEATRPAIAESPHRGMVMTLTLLGFGVKAGALGLHVALPLIYRAAPAPAAAAFAGAMLHAGLLGWLRFLPLGADLPVWGDALIGLGFAGTFYGAAVGALQRDARSVLAYSSISQMGIMLAAIGAALKAPGQSGAIIAALAVYALHHAFVKGALLLGTAVAAAAPKPHRVGRALIRLGLLVPVLALPGLPATSGMLAKEYLKESVAGADQPWAAAFGDILPWTAVATTLLVARFLWIVWPLRAVPSERALSRLSLGAWVALLLAVACGVWAQPIRSPPELWTAKVLWEVTWPAVLGGAVAWAAAQAVAAGRIRRVPWIPAGDVVVPITEGTRRGIEAWSKWAYGPLPATRNRVRNAATSLLSDRRWRAPVRIGEEVLAAWPAAVLLLLAVTLVLILLAPRFS